MFSPHSIKKRKKRSKNCSILETLANISFILLIGSHHTHYPWTCTWTTNLFIFNVFYSICSPAKLSDYTKKGNYITRLSKVKIACFRTACQAVANCLFPPSTALEPTSSRDGMACNTIDQFPMQVLLIWRKLLDRTTALLGIH